MRVSEMWFVAARSLCAFALLAPLSAFAHHSYAMFDMKQEISLEGTVKNFQWTNPHIWIDMAVVNKQSGKLENWSIEGKGPVELIKDGWQYDSIKVGDKVSLVVHPLKQGSNGGSLLKILVNGKEIGPAKK